MDLNSKETFWLTNFISDDKSLLDRITKNLIYQGFELKGKQKVNLMYEDGNRIVTIQTQSDNDFKLPKDCYSINVIVNKSINNRYQSTNNSKKNIAVQKTNPLDNISNSENSTSKKIIDITNLSDLMRIATTSIKKISIVLSPDWEKVSYPENLEPLDEWYSYKNSNQVIESYLGWDNGIGKDVKITSFEFSQKELLDEVLLELKNSDFKLVEKNDEYYNFEKNNIIIEIYLNKKNEKGGLYKVEISSVIDKSKALLEKKI
ncbi:hypothetical protein [Flavobacterium sp. H4147]|uniref:hypothetical protein n=1 Tax=Flavobacterium sp. H4147 TaxID=3034149 RepID=UPI0023EB7580|nr:hypothetical protein [Flavobacterium sp. H4147]